jgi:DNA-binding NtrC family response regulator
MSAKVRFLIVDDEPVVRQAFTRILSGDHCTVETAADGPQALARMQQQPFDVVLLDLKMPGMDGMTVLQTIKSNWPDSEVIVITGFAALDSAKASVMAGAFDYLPKPVGPEEVIKATNGALLHKQWALRRDPRPAASQFH